MRTLFKIFMILGILLAVAFFCHAFWIEPICYFTYATWAFVSNFSLNNILGSGLGQLGALSGGLSLLGGLTKYARNKASELKQVKTTATTQISALKQNTEGLMGENLEKTKQLEQDTKIISELETKADKIAQKYIVRNNRPYEEIKCAVTAK